MNKNAKLGRDAFVYLNIAMIVGIKTYTPPPPECVNNTISPYAETCLDAAPRAIIRGAAWPLYLLWRAWWAVLR